MGWESLTEATVLLAQGAAFYGAGLGSRVGPGHPALRIVIEVALEVRRTQLCMGKRALVHPANFISLIEYIKGGGVQVRVLGLRNAFVSTKSHCVKS